MYTLYTFTICITIFPYKLIDTILEVPTRIDCSFSCIFTNKTTDSAVLLVFEAFKKINF